MKRCGVYFAVFLIVCVVVVFKFTTGGDRQNNELEFDAHSVVGETHSDSAELPSDYSNSEVDWEAIKTISDKYESKIIGLIRQLDEVKALQIPNNADPQSEQHRNWLRHQQEMGILAKAIRAVEKKKWEEMSAYLTPYELRKYKVHRSTTGKEIKKMLEWFEPSEGELLAFYLKQESEERYFDDIYDGDRSQYLGDATKGLRRIVDIQANVRPIDKGRKMIEQLEGRDIDAYYFQKEKYDEWVSKLSDKRLFHYRYGKKSEKEQDRVRIEEEMAEMYTEDLVTSEEMADVALNHVMERIEEETGLNFEEDDDGTGIILDLSVEEN